MCLDKAHCLLVQKMLGLEHGQVLSATHTCANDLYPCNHAGLISDTGAACGFAAGLGC